MKQSNHLKVVGVPTFNFNGCDGATYRSFVVVHKNNPTNSIEDLRGMRCVINTPTSHSGMNVLQDLIAPFAGGGRFFRSVQISGSHEKSIHALSIGQADVAAIDCITYGLLQKFRPQALQDIRVINKTIAVPAPPFVTHAESSDEVVDLLWRAINAVLPATDLNLISISPGNHATYQPIAHISKRAKEKSISDFARLN